MTPDEIAADDALLDRTVLVDGWPHEQPDEPLGVEAAHQAWQSHAPCAMASCARKRAAYAALVEAKRIVPDERAEYQQ